MKNYICIILLILPLLYFVGCTEVDPKKVEETMSEISEQVSSGAKQAKESISTKFTELRGYINELSDEEFKELYPKIESWCDTTKVKIERERERLGITNEDIVEKWNEIYQKSRERYDELIKEAERE